MNYWFEPTYKHYMQKWTSAKEYFGYWDSNCERTELCVETGTWRGWTRDQKNRYDLIGYFKWDDITQVGNLDAPGTGFPG